LIGSSERDGECFGRSRFAAAAAEEEEAAAAEGDCTLTESSDGCDSEDEIVGACAATNPGVPGADLMVPFSKELIVGVGEPGVGVMRRGCFGERRGVDGGGGLLGVLLMMEVSRRMLPDRRRMKNSVGELSEDDCSETARIANVSRQ
jgi:hypothetical protein